MRLDKLVTGRNYIGKKDKVKIRVVSNYGREECGCGKATYFKLTVTLIGGLHGYHLFFADSIYLLRKLPAFYLGEFPIYETRRYGRYYLMVDSALGLKTFGRQTREVKNDK